MGHRMGIFQGEHQPDSLFVPGMGDLLRSAQIYPERPILAREDWASWRISTWIMPQIRFLSPRENAK
jgi:hypothetical protein